MRRNWKPKTWERKQASAHKMVEQIKSELPYEWCAWWNETDPVTKSPYRTWRDFQSQSECKDFADNHEPRANYAHIKLLSWHPNH